MPAVMGTSIFMTNLLKSRGRNVCNLLVLHRKYNRKSWTKEERKNLMENHNETDKKNVWIRRQRVVLDQHKNRKLKLATEMGPGPAQFHFEEEPMKEEIIVKRDRKLNRLQDELPSYNMYYDQEYKDEKNKSIYYDPQFNPHLHEERYRVDPDDEPFNAIYAGNEQTEGGQQYTNVKNVTTPELWSFVELLARHKIAPEIPTRKLGEPIKPMPSGYVPPPDTAPDLPYFVARTRNHLLPVYYGLSKDPDECMTYVKNVMGDMWLFEEQLRKHLESLNPTQGKLVSTVREPDEMVGFRGKHLHQVVDWLHHQGF